MHPTDDSKLLRQYVETRSDEAFATLVARHVNLVYSVAKRCVGDPHQAEEIAQSVFILLANKAAMLRHDKALSSWLFQTTRLTASNFIRSETRRHRRELEAHMQSQLDQPDRDLWQRIAPLLDDAVAELSDPDRRAILLRFYEGKSLREVGIALDASEDAAQKRLTRAVERLREFFAQRGVTVGTSGLAGIIGTNAVQAAPAGLAVTISTATTLSGAAGVTTTTLASKVIAMTTTQKSLITAALVAAVATGVYEARRAAGLHQQVMSLQQRQAPLTQQIELINSQRDEALRQLIAMRNESQRLKADNTELLRLRGEVARLRATAKTETQIASSVTNAPLLHPWLERVKRLKARVDDLPGARIPELRLAADQDWLDVCRDELETDTDYRKAMSRLRAVVEHRFVLLLQKALQKFQTSGEARFPSAVSQLGPYLDSPHDHDMLERWQIVSASSFPSLQLGNAEVISQNPIDVEFDQLWAVGPKAYGVVASVPVEQRPELLNSLVETLLASGQTLENPTQLRSLAATSAQRKALENLVSEFDKLSAGQKTEALNELLKGEPRSGNR